MRTLLWIKPNSDCVLDEVNRIESLIDVRVLKVTGPLSSTDSFRNFAPDVILIAGCMQEGQAESLLTDAKSAFAAVPVVIYEPDGEVAQGPQLTSLGAAYFLAHRASAKDLAGILTAASRVNLRLDSTEAETSEGWQKLLVGSSPAIRETQEIIRLAADRRSTVLIVGETGTGKELAARAIHLASSRSHRPMVAVNCAALPEHLLEAELFGHTKGAFTGAAGPRPGLFEKAHESTIFLDEIGEMPISLQPKLLRVLQEREFHRLGSSDPLRVNIRVVAAANIDLREAVAQRRFREDLYYRLNVVPLRMPPLRERSSDIPELCEHFLTKVAAQEAKPRKRLGDDALDLLLTYAWPGNVRQLEHAIEAATILSGDRMTLGQSDFQLPLPAAISSEGGQLSSLNLPESGLNFEALISAIERRLLESALHKAGGNKAKAADLLGMKRTTLISKSKALQVCA